jgi:hypothetical protein
VPEKHKDMVLRLVEAINEGDEAAAVDELFAPRAAPRVKRLFAEFRLAFTDWHEEILELVAERDTVVGRFRCSGMHLGTFLGNPPTGKRMEVEECSSCGLRAGSSWTSGAWRTAWAGCDSWVCCHRDLELLRTPTSEVRRRPFPALGWIELLTPLHKIV